MRRFVERVDRGQTTLFPECLKDWTDEDNPVRVIDAFVDKLDLSGLGFDGVAPESKRNTNLGLSPSDVISDQIGLPRWS